MTTKGYILLGKLTAIFSFLIGTLIFGLFFQTSSFRYLETGVIYIIIAVLINLIVLTLILKQAKKDGNNEKRIVLVAKRMLINIPIALIYIWLGTVLLNTMRITFTNSTKVPITDININGCGGGYINELKIGEKKTVWIKIKGDCSIYIDYLKNGKRKEETVVGYISGNMGLKASHKIDGNDKEIFL